MLETATNFNVSLLLAAALLQQMISSATIAQCALCAPFFRLKPRNVIVLISSHSNLHVTDQNIFLGAP